MVKNADGTRSLSEKSRNQLQETDSVSKLYGVGECDASKNEYYEVEKVLEKGLTRTFTLRNIKSDVKVTHLEMTCGFQALLSKNLLPSKVCLKGDESESIQ